MQSTSINSGSGVYTRLYRLECWREATGAADLGFDLWLLEGLWLWVRGASLACFGLLPRWEALLRLLWWVGRLEDRAAFRLWEVKKENMLLPLLADFACLFFALLRLLSALASRISLIPLSIDVGHTAFLGCKTFCAPYSSIFHFQEMCPSTSTATHVL